MNESQPSRPHPNGNRGENRPSRFRFGIGGMLLISLVACGMGAAGYYMIQGGLLNGLTAPAGDDGEAVMRARLVFMILVLAGPTLLIVGARIAWSVLNTFRNSR